MQPLGVIIRMNVLAFVKGHVKVKLLPHHAEAPTLECRFCSEPRQKHRTRNCRKHPLKQMRVTCLNCDYFLEQDALLTSTGRSWSPLPSCTMKTDIRKENQSLLAHLSHIPEVSGQNPQGETTLRSLFSLATSGYRNKR